MRLFAQEAAFLQRFAVGAGLAVELDADQQAVAANLQDVRALQASAAS